jgi:hypothetical protein
MLRDHRPKQAHLLTSGCVLCNKCGLPCFNSNWHFAFATMCERGTIPAVGIAKTRGGAGTKPSDSDVPGLV